MVNKVRNMDLIMCEKDTEEIMKFVKIGMVEKTVLSTD